MNTRSNRKIAGTYFFRKPPLYRDLEQRWPDSLPLQEEPRTAENDGDRLVDSLGSLCFDYIATVWSVHVYFKIWHANLSYCMPAIARPVRHASCRGRVCPAL